MNDFFAMGGYAAFVWPAYGLTAVVLALNAILPCRRERALLRQLAAEAKRQGSQ
ncbi:MAG: heme exporter protein CcmD [Gammaproteobacteria bacterium]|nr:heme exporter protein CcmD [Gammaproteobacteria bacterium]